MSLDHIPHIDQTFGESDEPVTTRYGIQTVNGVLRLVGASFFGNLPNNEMPPEITVERTGGTLDAKDRYVHYSRIEQLVNERMEGSRYRINALEIEVRKLKESLKWADIINDSKDRTIELYIEEVDRLCMNARAGFFARIRAFFGAKA